MISAISDLTKQMYDECINMGILFRASRSRVSHVLDMQAVESWVWRFCCIFGQPCEIYHIYSSITRRMGKGMASRLRADTSEISSFVVLRMKEVHHILSILRDPYVQASVRYEPDLL
jgi:hypothetical protein